MTTLQTHADAVAMIVSVIRDRQRSDRLLRMADDGHYYPTPDKTFLSDDGPYTPPYVSIPFADASDATDEEAEEWAENAIDELDAQVTEE